MGSCGVCAGRRLVGRRFNEVGSPGLNFADRCFAGDELGNGRPSRSVALRGRPAGRALEGIEILSMNAPSHRATDVLRERGQ